jgi:hypothetical protein
MLEVLCSSILVKYFVEKTRESIEKTKSVLLTRHQNTGQNRDINTYSKRIIRKCMTVQILVFGNDSNKSKFACYHSVQDRLSSHLLSKTIRIRIYKTIILLVVLCGLVSYVNGGK